jgi:predicted methyltransferase
MDDLYKQKAKELEFYHFQAGQTVASIGAQCCNWEAVFAAAIDSLSFYLEDIDTAYFNEQQAGFAWNYYATLRQKPISSSYKLILGDEQKTSLPESLFDKILIINSFHEFTYQEEMLADIAHKLKPGGILYIDEALARKSGELHSVCHKRIYLDKELIDILKQNGYEYVDGIVMNYRKSKPVRKIFAFRKNS